uniref:GATA-type transcription activator N-terminal domain-containing protein n=1 Tax=Noccaea caerulescens TaxID=107243 RepID=A0A1J3EKN2_NOCCA
MGLRALPLQHNGAFVSTTKVPFSRTSPRISRNPRWVVVSAKQEKDDEKNKEEETSLFTRLTDALDFSQVRSEKDAELLYEAREATKSGGKMSKEQYGALRRKIGGTYKDFFKSYVEVDGEYVEEGWVDKTCKICKKDTKGEARQVDKLGRYVHVSCLQNPSTSGNFFTRLFSR